MPKVYPVIHYKDDDTTIAEAELAKEVGADGVFLISHIGRNENLIPLAIKIKELFGFKVGLNFLGNTAIYTANVVKDNNLDMIWADSCGVTSKGLDQEGIELKKWYEENKNIEVFASVAFKYQAVDNNPPLAALEAQKAGFIPTTSGSGTGSAPTIDKIKSMSEETSGLLGVASGMNCENINSFKPYLSHILVSTGVSKDEHHFDYEKLYRFIILAKMV